MKEFLEWVVYPLHLIKEDTETQGYLHYKITELRVKSSISGVLGFNYILFNDVQWSLSAEKYLKTDSAGLLFRIFFFNSCLFCKVTILKKNIQRQNKTTTLG